jgi:hypothetical protein
MINVRYTVAPSKIPNAGQGLFADQGIRAGTVITAPDRINETVSFAQLDAFPDDSPQAHSSVRWFEDRYTISTDWPDECYVNHSFTPNGLWHLGFIFAGRDIDEGEEITIDYRYLLAPGVQIGFFDSATNRPIIGFDWDIHLIRSTQSLARVLEQRYGHRELPA